MTTADILEQLGALSLADRLTVLETALHRIREELSGQPPAREASVSRDDLALAADALRQDYENDSELTVFSVLEGEPIHEAG